MSNFARGEFVPRCNTPVNHDIITKRGEGGYFKISIFTKEGGGGGGLSKQCRAITVFEE